MIIVFLRAKILKVFQIKQFFHRNSEKQANSTFETLKILHRLSISSPSILHRNDGPSMEYRWSIYGISREEKRKNIGLSCIFLQKNIV